MDVTMKLGRRVIPIRISDGLPSRPLGYKFHLPYRMSRLVIDIAEAIEPEELLAIGPSDRRRRILDVINLMAPPDGTYAERPNTALAKNCLRRHVQTGSSALKCFLMGPSGACRIPRRRPNCSRTSSGTACCRQTRWMTRSGLPARLCGSLAAGA